jgi:hypothetical protein
MKLYACVWKSLSRSWSHLYADNIYWHDRPVSAIAGLSSYENIMQLSELNCDPWVGDHVKTKKNTVSIIRFSTSVIIFVRNWPSHRIRHFPCLFIYYFDNKAARTASLQCYQCERVKSELYFDLTCMYAIHPVQTRIYSVFVKLALKTSEQQVSQLVNSSIASHLVRFSVITTQLQSRHVLCNVSPSKTLSRRPDDQLHTLTSNWLLFSKREVRTPTVASDQRTGPWPIYTG